MQIENTLIIFSSSKSIRVAQRIKEKLSGKIAATIWNQGFFDGSHLPPVWTFLKNLMCYDFAVIVLGADDVLEKAKTYIPKDNVVFELGAVMARIGPQKTFVFKPQQPPTKIPTYFDTPDPSKIKEGSDIEKITTFIDYTHIEDDCSIDAACEIVLNKIARMKRQDKFHSDLPSQGLAHGYASNFLSPVCNSLMINPNQAIDWNPSSGFTVTVLIPDRIMKFKEVAPELERILGYPPTTLDIYPDNQKTARHTSVFLLNRPHNDSPLHIIDIPTTLRTSLKVIDRIDEYWLKDNSEDFVSKLQHREIMNFYKALEQICLEDSVLQKASIFIKPVEELEEHLRGLDIF